MNTRCLLPLRPDVVRRWLRLLLLCSLFSALHAPIGAWVVSSISQQAVVQICTPQGLQWVGLDPAAADPAQPEPSGQAKPLQPCVWAAAQLAIAPPCSPDGRFPGAAAGDTPAWVMSLAPPSDHAQRVLLMSAMRAPPWRL